MKVLNWPWFSEDESKVLAGLPDGGGVDNGSHLFDVRRDDIVEQFLVSVVQRGDVDELVEVGRATTEVSEYAHLLFILGEHRGRKKSVDAEDLTFLQRKSHALK